MSRCEDYPYCGHDMNDCPDPDVDTDQFWPLPCVECNDQIKRGEEQPNAPSMHATCAEAYFRSGYHDDPWEDEVYDDGEVLEDQEADTYF